MSQLISDTHHTLAQFTSLMNMKKVYFIESSPEHKVWEKQVESKDGKITPENSWKLCS